MTEQDIPQTLIEAVRYFADLDVCHRYLRRIRWPGGKVVCPHCGGNRIGEIKTIHVLRCKDCRKKIYDLQGTIFEDSKIKLDKWLPAVWSVANCKNGISSHELARALGVTQKTAWFMAHRIREAMRTGSFTKFNGPSEADTTYVGGKADNMHAKERARKITGRGAVNKTAVHGVLQRSTPDVPSRISAKVIGSENAEALLSQIRRLVERGTMVFTDAAGAYGEICLTHFHQAIDHSLAYVRGNVHVNGVENFWALLKRAIKGTYVSVAPFHLERYVTEEAFRFNERKTNDGTRFDRVMQQVVGRRLTWRVLTAQDDAGFMGLT